MSPPTWEIGRAGHLEWVRARVSHPRAILFAPPLIGGHYIQQIRNLRRLIRSGFDLISFNYSGHGGSGEKFRLKATLDDTRRVLETAHAMARSEGLDLHGVGVCYAAIPLLHWAGRREGIFSRIALVNAIFALRPGAVIRSFFAYYQRLRINSQRPPTRVEALRRYADLLFPGVAKNRHGFGILHRRRTRLVRTLRDAFSMRPLADIRLRSTPALCLYGRRDPVIRVSGGGVGAAYEAQARRVCPLVRFHILSSDHFLSHPAARAAAADEILRFLALKPIHLL